MPSYLDLGVLGIVLISALLSMLRGFTREVLAIASWAAAAAAAYYFYPYVQPHLQPYISKPILAQAISAAVVFFVTLIVVSLFTVRIADAILNSKIGPLDRSLGFLFGAARGFLLAVVAFWIFNWLVGESRNPIGCATPRPARLCKRPRTRIIEMLPADAATTLEGWIKNKNAPPLNEEPPDENAPAKTGAAADGAGHASAADKQKLDTIINKLPGSTQPAKP